MNKIIPSVNKKLAEHQNSMKPKVYTLNNHIHFAYGYSVVNCTLIEGKDECILVDTLTSMEVAETVASEFKKITSKPIKTIIYTHFHADHVSGTEAFVSKEDIESGKVEIICQEQLTGHVIRDVGLIAPILGRRAIYQFGMRLPLGEDGTVGAGLGPPQRPGRRTFAPPSKTFDDFYQGEAGGIKFEIYLNPSETEDQCAVWLPETKTLLSADAVYKSFPNIYALRGTRFRNPMIWANGIDRLREFEAETLIPHHGYAIEGKDKIEDLLIDYRDAIQFVHDQTLRYMNKGYTYDEIMELVEMPDHLRDHPWLGEFYGSYKHSIPAIFVGYLGWFQGDPVSLDPIPWKEKASRYVEMMGGRNKLIEATKTALSEGDDKWAAELSTWLVRADRKDHEARNIKAEALRSWSYKQVNATWRNWGLTSAMELNSELDLSKAGMVLGSKDQVSGFPLDGILKVMTVRLVPEKAWDTKFSIKFETTDSQESCALEIRKGICQLHEIVPEQCDANISFDRKFLIQWVFGETTIKEALESKGVKFGGNKDQIIEFFEKFEPFNQLDDIAIAAR